MCLLPSAPFFPLPSIHTHLRSDENSADVSKSEQNNAKVFVVFHHTMILLFLDIRCINQIIGFQRLHCGSNDEKLITSRD